MNVSNKRRIDKKSAAFIRGRRLIIFICQTLIRVQKRPNAQSNC